MTGAARTAGIRLARGLALGRTPAALAARSRSTVERPAASEDVVTGLEDELAGDTERPGGRSGPAFMARSM